MRDYEIVLKFYNACGGLAHAQTFFEEAELADPDDFVRMKHGREFDHFLKEPQPDGRVIYTFDNGSVTYVYEFTPL
ncbi:MAG: hypothetical protein IJ357_01920 [Oscillospiraceae bacterium]|nr:hypothetical protein [Oscillospiraceae bacterium]